MKTEEAELELRRRVSLLALGGDGGPANVLGLLVAVLDKYSERWVRWNAHGLDPFLGRRSGEVFKDPRHTRRRSDRDSALPRRFRLEQGRLRVSYTDGHYAEFAPAAYAAALYTRLSAKPVRLVSVIRKIEKLTPEQAKPRE